LAEQGVCALGKVPELLPALAGFAVELSGVGVSVVSFGRLGASGCEGVLRQRRAGLDILDDVMGEPCVAEGERRAQQLRQDPRTLCGSQSRGLVGLNYQGLRLFGMPLREEQSSGSGERGRNQVW
jgi:hypothetical protein